MFVYAIIGMNLFGNIKPQESLTHEINFQDFPAAMLTLFRYAGAAMLTFFRFTGAAMLTLFRCVVAAMLSLFRCTGAAMLTFFWCAGLGTLVSAQAGQWFLIPFIVLTFIRHAHMPPGKDLYDDVRRLTG